MKPFPSISPGQCRAARGLLDWTQCHLAQEAGVSRSTVRDFESSRHGLQKASEAQIVDAFEKAGVCFIAAGGAGAGSAGAGVRLAHGEGVGGAAFAGTATPDKSEH